MGNGPSSIPLGLQANAINIGMQCSQGLQPLNTIFSFTTPITANIGQQFRLTDGNATITLPPEIVAQTVQSGAAYYSAYLDLVINTTNTVNKAQQPGQEPYSVYYTTSTIYRNVNNATTSGSPGSILSWSKRDALSFELGTPDEGHVLLANTTAQTDVSLTSYRLHLVLFRSDGSLVYPDGPGGDLYCYPPSSGNIIASVAHRPTPSDGPGPLLDTSIGGQPIAAPPLGQKSTRANIPISCAASSNQATRLNYTFGATMPLSLTPGQIFNITSITNLVNVPGEVVKRLTSQDNGNSGACGLFLGLSAPSDASTDATGLGYVTRNAAPDSLDLSSQFIASDRSTPTPLDTGRYVDCGASKPAEFSLPNVGYLTSPALTAGVSGSTFGLGLASLSGTLNGIDGQTGAIDSESFECFPTDPLALLSAPIV